MKNLEPPIVVSRESDVAGKKLAIIVGVHGNEKGPQLEWDWLTQIEVKRGTLYVIFANPTAAEMNKRFVNVNLNRRFGLDKDEYPEDHLARRIEEVLDECDASLDLHMYNELMDRPFAICNRRSNEVAQILPTHYIINIPDEVNGGGTDDYMANKGKIGICFETGSVDRPKEYSHVIRDGVMSFLSMFGMSDYVPTKQKEPTILTKSSTKFVENTDIHFSRNYSSFDEVKKGEVICTEAGIEYTAEQDCYILFPRPKNPVGAEAYYTLVRTTNK